METDWWVFGAIVGSAIVLFLAIVTANFYLRRIDDLLAELIEFRFGADMRDKRAMERIADAYRDDDDD